MVMLRVICSEHESRIRVISACRASKKKRGSYIISIVLKHDYEVAPISEERAKELQATSEH